MSICKELRHDSGKMVSTSLVLKNSELNALPLIDLSLAPWVHFRFFDGLVNRY